jgi:hypothetical protein
MADSEQQREIERNFWERYNFLYRYNNPGVPKAAEATLGEVRVSRIRDLENFLAISEKS